MFIIVKTNIVVAFLNVASNKNLMKIPTHENLQSCLSNENAIKARHLVVHFIIASLYKYMKGLANTAVQKVDYFHSII